MLRDSEGKCDLSGCTELHVRKIDKLESTLNGKVIFGASAGLETLKRKDIGHSLKRRYKRE